MQENARHILAADIGATHSRFALFDLCPGDSPLPLALLREQWYAGADFPDFSLLLKAVRRDFADRDELPVPRMAVIAPAGPVRDGECRMTNLPWVLREADIRTALQLERAFLINDFAAQGHACLLPGVLELSAILPGRAVAGSPAAVAGAGTGFGKALVLPGREADLCPALSGAPDALRPSPATTAAPEEGRTPEKSRAPLPDPAVRVYPPRERVLPSEGGNSEFPFSNREEYAFADFVRKETGLARLIGDTIVSGSGLAHLFAFHTGLRPHPHEATAKAADHPPVLEWFARFYGRICRNFVLDTLALGGLYITGGMALRLPVLEHPAFREEFHDSLAQRGLLEQVPVWHIRNRQAGLWGAAIYGMLRYAE